MAGIDLLPEKQEELLDLLKEFKDNFVKSERGQKHIASYRDSRAEGIKNFDSIEKAVEEGKDITDLVLLKLLPHANTVNNRAKGAWIHIAPAITKDIQQWFEGGGWLKAEDWPKTAEEIWEFINRSLDPSEGFSVLCSGFSSSPKTKGIQSGFLSPILNALAPERFAIINNKPRLLINSFLGTNYSSNIKDYPELNNVTIQLIKQFKEVFGPIAAEEKDITEFDVFDMFSHWLVGEKRYWKPSKSKSVTPTGEYWKHEDSLKIVNSESFEERLNIWQEILPEVRNYFLDNFVMPLLLDIDCPTPDKAVKKLLLVKADITKGKRNNNQLSVINIAQKGFKRVIKGKNFTVKTRTAGGEYTTVKDWLNITICDMDYSFCWLEFRLSCDFVNKEFSYFYGLTFRPSQDQSQAAEKAKALFPKIEESSRSKKYICYEIMSGSCAFQDIELLIPDCVQALKNAFENVPKVMEIWKTFGDKSPIIESNPQPSPAVNESILSQNLILYGPPGTGKTYSTVEIALELCQQNIPETRKEQVELFNALHKKGQIELVTFHQSYSYEEFVEGIKPEVDEITGNVKYECHDGIFKKAALMAGKQTSSHNSKYEFNENSINFWKMSLGNTSMDSDAEVYEQCIEENCILLGYGEGLDFKGCDDRLSIQNKYQEVKPETAKGDYSVTSMDLFKNRMQKGDIVIISDGNLKFRAIGKITGDYYSKEPGAHYSQCRDVEWMAVFEESLPRETIFGKSISQMTLYQIRNKYLKMDVLKNLISGTGDGESANHVLIIDEINRGNISKIFGELITLLEPDKRLGGKNELRVKLPYSQKEFGVPSNLHIIGTMNTADRSIALMDTALRRRFEFREIMPDPEIILNSEFPIVEKDGEKIDLAELLAAINRRIEFLFDRDHQVGHSYFLGIDSYEKLEETFKKRIIPLLQEYFYEDWEKIQMVFADLSDDTDDDGHHKIRDNAIITCRKVSNDYLQRVIGEDLPVKRVYIIPDEIPVESIVKIYKS